MCRVMALWNVNKPMEVYFSIMTNVVHNYVFSSDIVVIGLWNMVLMSKCVFVGV